MLAKRNEKKSTGRTGCKFRSDKINNMIMEVKIPLIYHFLPSQLMNTLPSQMTVTLR